MAATSTTNSMSVSTSSFHTSQSQPASTSGNILSYSDNPLTQLPTVDFNFEDLRKRMSDFTVRFDAFIEKGRKRVLEERNEFRGRLSEINEEQRSTSTQISTLQSSLSTHDHLVSREQAEKSEMHAQISQLEQHQSNQLTARDRLKQNVAATQRQIEAKLQAQREYAEKMDGQSRLNGPELNFWETYLGCRIEGAGDECVVRVVYSFPPLSSSSTAAATTTTTTTKNNTKNPAVEREASFELEVPQTGGAGYKIVHAQPKLDPVKVDRVVGMLNESRDIAVLLKGMRGLFAEEMK